MWLFRFKKSRCQLPGLTGLRFPWAAGAESGFVSKKWRPRCQKTSKILPEVRKSGKARRRFVPTVCSVLLKIFRRKSGFCRLLLVEMLLWRSASSREKSKEMDQKSHGLGALSFNTWGKKLIKSKKFFSVAEVGVSCFGRHLGIQNGGECSSCLFTRLSQRKH